MQCQFAHRFKFNAQRQHFQLMRIVSCLQHIASLTLWMRTKGSAWYCSIVHAWVCLCVQGMREHAATCRYCRHTYALFNSIDSSLSIRNWIKNFFLQNKKNSEANLKENWKCLQNTLILGLPFASSLYLPLNYLLCFYYWAMLLHSSESI